MIELDVLRPRAEFQDGGDWRRAVAGPADDGAAGPLLVAHDWGDAARRKPLTLDEVLDAFTRPPLDGVADRLRPEDRRAARTRSSPRSASGAWSGGRRSRRWRCRACAALAELDPGVVTGWTLPKVTRDWNSMPWAKPLVSPAR